MATGVLVLGVGNGTKQLGGFIECTKSYETVVLFGVATDSYDAVGKVVKTAEYDHVTKEQVEEALQQFRGDIMQRPPIFSALRIQGKRLYEYAREGKEVPVDIEKRSVRVAGLEMVDWNEGGSHDYRWPVEEAAAEDKAVAQKVLHFNEDRPNKKRKLDTSDDGNTVSGKVVETTADSASMSEKAGEDEESESKPARTELADAIKDSARAHEDVRTESRTTQPCPAPACRLRMTVTSGFYVRSLCHDLGMAVGSLGMMSSLVRTRQSDFELKRNVLEYEDLEKGEEVWGPKVEQMLKGWQQRPEAPSEDTTDDKKSLLRKKGGSTSPKIKETHSRRTDRAEAQ
jgi:tRNA pseudouridine55 synthase